MCGGTICDARRGDKEGSSESILASGLTTGAVMRRFLMVVEKADGNHSAYFPDLPGCVATGKTPEPSAMAEYVEVG